MAESTMTMHFKHLGEHIRISVEKDGKVQWSNSFSADELDDLIEQLGRLRARLPQAVNSQIDSNARVPTTPHPGITTRDQGEEGFEILLRHPGFGWLSFLLNDQACEAMTAAMLARKRD